MGEGEGEEEREEEKGGMKRENSIREKSIRVISSLSSVIDNRCNCRIIQMRMYKNHKFYSNYYKTVKK